MATISIERMLIMIARAIYGKITPCSGRSSLMDCFHRYNDRLFLYFNTSDDSTRVVSAKIPKGN